MTKIIGLTGGIGSGKTTIAKYFESKGIPVYIADDRAREITNSPEILELIKKEFGADLFDHSTLDRKKLAQIVFNNPEKLTLLNAIIHPAVQADFNIWLKNHSAHKYVIKESALLLQNSNYLKLHLVIAVVAPLELRIGRVLLRDKTSRKEILDRINVQLSEKELIEKSDYVIYNIDKKLAFNQVDEFLKTL